MDRSVRRLPTTAVRLSITVRWVSITIGRPPSIPAVDRPAVPARRRLAILAWRPLAATVRRRVHPAAGRRLAVAAVLAAAIVLVATVPARLARLAMDSAIWDLARSVSGGMPWPDLSPQVLPLLLGAIVVLAVVSSSTGHHHHHDQW
jgi:hypothetical protein